MRRLSSLKNNKEERGGGWEWVGGRGRSAGVGREEGDYIKKGKPRRCLHF